MGGGFLQQVAKISHIHRMSLRCYGPNRNQERKKKSETHFRAWGGRKVFFFLGGGFARGAHRRGPIFLPLPGWKPLDYFGPVKERNIATEEGSTQPSTPHLFLSSPLSLPAHPFSILLLLHRANGAPNVMQAAHPRAEEHSASSSPTFQVPHSSSCVHYACLLPCTPSAIVIATTLPASQPHPPYTLNTKP